MGYCGVLRVLRSWWCWRGDACALQILFFYLIEEKSRSRCCNALQRRTTQCNAQLVATAPLLSRQRQQWGSAARRGLEPD